MIRYGDLEVPRAAIAELVVALRDAGESNLAHKLGNALDANVEELVLSNGDHARILAALAWTAIPELEAFARAVEGQLRRPANGQLGKETSTLRETRLATNEAFFRELNERLDEDAPESRMVVALCECADEDCTTRLRLTREEYEAVRSDPKQFVVANGHADPELESVVTRSDGFEVVRKTGVAGEVAARLDEAT